MKEATKEIIKGQPIRIEYGDFDNFATLIPMEILEVRPEGHYAGALILWKSPKSDFTIELWQYGIDNIDFDSFGGLREELIKE